MLGAKLFTRFADIAWEIAPPQERAVFLIFLPNLRRFSHADWSKQGKLRALTGLDFCRICADLAILIGPD